jgi:hypothetical protein
MSFEDADSIDRITGSFHPFLGKQSDLWSLIEPTGYHPPQKPEICLTCCSILASALYFLKKR